MSALKLIDNIIDNIDDYLQNRIDKIFQIGFNKCATRSMGEWFDNNGISSRHWIDVPTKQQRDLYQFKQYIGTNRVIGRKIYNNYSNNKALLDNYDEYTFYGDFGVFIQKSQDYDLKFLNNSNASKMSIYKLLIKQYPNSVYILNIRNVNKWLKSRFLHYKDDYFPLENLKKGLNIHDNVKLVFGWKQLWYDYICNVLDYFNTNDIMDRLLIYNLDIDSTHKFISFFDEYGIKLFIKDCDDIAGKTKPTGNRLNEWNEIIKQHPDLMETESNEYTNILNQCSQRNINIRYIH